MSQSKSPRSPPNGPPLGGPAPRPASTGTTGTTGTTGRFERPGAPRPAARPAVSRHAAITRTLHNYASYKTWAEKMRNNWQPGKEPKP